MTPSENKPQRRARGFARAGGMIGTQMRTAAARRGFANARLRALWPDLAGPEVAAICAPVKLAAARGPAGGLLTLAVSGAHAPQLQMMLPVLRERLNAALGPGSVGRIQLAHGVARPAVPAPRAGPAAAPVSVDLGRLDAPLSSIGDQELRAALRTLAGNVISRRRQS